jgi:Domain of unknown function (DUF4926)
MPMSKEEVAAGTTDLDLEVDLPEYGLTAGDLDTMVLLHGRGGYEVEFIEMVRP